VSDNEPFLCQFVDEIRDIPARSQTDLKHFLTKKFNVFSAQKGSLSDKQVLVLARDYDPEADIIGICLLSRGIDYVRLNVEDIPSQIRIRYTINQNSDPKVESTIREQTLDTSKISVVWQRQFDVKLINFDGQEFARTYSFQQWEEALRMLQRGLTTSCQWISPHDATLKASDRLEQLSIAKTVGFDIPATLITNDPEAALDFYYSHDRDIVLKALHHHSVEVQGKVYSMYTHKVREQDLRKLDDLIYAPCILQQRLPKKSDLRVTVVGEQVFAAELDSQPTGIGIDDDLHRNLSSGNISIRAIKLKDTVSECCIKIIKSLGLRFGAIDFVIRKDDNSLTFLEVNPMGDWYWIESRTKQPITEAVTDLIEDAIHHT
jgi:glutathione synthase/RimK-type ligase-like ATP-grasp enzyme